MKFSLRKGDFISLENVFGKKKICIVLSGADIDLSSEKIKKIVVSDVKNNKSLKITYPSSYITDIKKMNKNEMFFYIHKGNKHLLEHIFKQKRGANA